MSAKLPAPPLSLWAVYDHPADHPDCYVARRWEVGGARPGPTTDVAFATDLAALRAWLRGRGLERLARVAGDDPVIIESWLGPAARAIAGAQ